MWDDPPLCKSWVAECAKFFCWIPLLEQPLRHSSAHSQSVCALHGPDPLCEVEPAATVTFVDGISAFDLTSWGSMPAKNYSVVVSSQTRYDRGTGDRSVEVTSCSSIESPQVPNPQSACALLIRCANAATCVLTSDHSQYCFSFRSPVTLGCGVVSPLRCVTKDHEVLPLLRWVRGGLGARTSLTKCWVSWADSVTRSDSVARAKSFSKLEFWNSNPNAPSRMRDFVPPCWEPLDDATSTTSTPRPI